MIKNIFFLSVLFASATSIFAQATYNSTGASTSWNLATSWTLAGGSPADSPADGIPDANDDVVILSAHTITLAANTSAKSLTINAGGTFNGGGQFLGLSRNFTNSGTVASGLKLAFGAATSIISSSSALVLGNFSCTSSNVTLAAGTQLTCNVGGATSFGLHGTSVFNNNGTLIIGTIYKNTATAPFPTFNNLSGATLRMSLNLSGGAVTMNSTNPSTIDLLGGVTSLPAWTYHHLSLQGSGSTKTAGATLNVNGNLTNNSGVTLNLASNTFNLLGNLSNSGTISNASTLTLNGTSSQTLTSSSAITIPTLTTTNSNTIILNTGTYNMGSSVSFPANLTLNGGATLNLNSNTLNLAGNLSNSGAITNIATVNLNGSANQTITSPQVHAISVLNSTNPSSIVINSGTYNISTSASFTGNLNLNAAGVTLNLNSHPFTIGGNLINSGNITNPAAVTFNGTSAQSISFTNNLSFTDMTSSNLMGVSITSGTHSITNSLTVSSGNLNVGANIITLASSAVKTAYIANCSGTISGSMIVQRYVPAGIAAYHDFSSPVASTTIDDWDNELYMTIGAPNNIAGYPGGDGMSSQDPTFYSVTTYNTNNDTYPNVTTGTTLGIGTGYTIWVADNMTSFPGRAIDSRGTPNMGNVPVAVTYNGANPSFPGWNLIGNPHAAFVSWADVVAASSNVNTNIQIYDGSGNYVDDLTQPNIAPGQGFYCEVTASTTVNFPQSSKRTVTSSTFMRTSNQVKNHDLKLRLSSGSNSFYHEINVNFEDKASLGYEKGIDIPFIKSPKQTAPYITFIDGSQKFIRNKMNTSSSVAVLPIEISAPIAGNYIIELEGLASNGVYTEAYLINNLTNKKIEIGEANIVTLYFEEGEINNNYSIVLRKANAPSLSNDGQSVSIFSTAEFINIKNHFETEQTVKVDVFNMLGQSVLSTTSNLAVNGAVSLPVSDLNSEVYLVKVTTVNNLQFAKKVVVTK